MKHSSRLSRTRRLIAHFRNETGGLAATEFAMIVPLMLVMFFGTVEICSGVAIDRKITLVARTLSDLISQYSNGTAMTDSDLKNAFAASYGILTPYDVAPVSATITELYVNPSSVAKVQWSKSATVSQSGSTVSVALTSSGYTQGQTLTIPSALLVANSYLILSEVNYTYKPTIGYILASSGIAISDKTYTRPRQQTCIPYPNAGCTTY
jgi:Flp pilus assembly protein TadG